MTKNHLSEFSIKPVPESKRFEFRLQFRGQPQQVVFDVPFHGGMHMLRVLQRFQAQYKLPIPLQRAPKGKPDLHIVRDDDD